MSICERGARELSNTEPTQTLIGALVVVLVVVVVDSERTSTDVI